MRENERGGSGECFYGQGRGGRGREPSRFGRRRGEEREREGWDSKSNPALSSARGPGDAGEEAATWGGRGSGAAWAREERRRRWRGGFGGGCRRRRVAGGRGRPDRWAPPVSVPERGGRRTGRPTRGRPSGRGMGRRPNKGKGGKRKKRKRIFLGLKLHLGDF
uniref:Uncharacterized protein n=1 Tax=Oryza sativa subsp. japonica TaxID=39947 RepID=Q6YTV4_ORYSJ|nr:hypothetical protein [Oryza sativa Japonica Group]